ncbi:MAG: DUF393 domain-containing protein [Halioglobus sp.]
MQTDNIKATPATLYYDGRCSLCMKEMARLGRLKSEKLALADIHALAPNQDLPDKDTLLRTLHLRQPDGQLLTGVDANVAAWSHTQHGYWFAWMRWPVLAPMVSLVYARWARWRYDRLYRNPCATASEASNATD